MKKHNVVNIVNFVRGCEPRDPGMDLLTPLLGEIALNKKYSYPNTVLLQYDAMLRADMVAAVKRELDENMELGVWIELARPLCEKVGIEWRGRHGYDWDWFVNPGFLMAYTPDQRFALIDEIMNKFKDIFGFYPESVGSWLLDSRSIGYMVEKYKVKGFALCREQLAVDAYTLWGGYYNQAYYPSKYNMLCPAQHAENEIHAPVFRMLGIHPVSGYNYPLSTKINGCPTMEPVWESGMNPDVMDWMFKSYYENESLGFAYTQLGQENSFGWEKIEPGLAMQLEKVKKLVDDGKVIVEKMRDTSEWFANTYKSTPSTALIATDSEKSADIQSYWYDSAEYRANLFLLDGKLYFRDIYSFDDTYRERYYDVPCLERDGIYDNLPVVDGRLWSGDGCDCGLYFGKPCDSLTVAEKGGNLLASAVFADGTRAEILFKPDSITVTGGGLAFRRKSGVADKLEVGERELRFVHEGFSYAVPVDGKLEATESGYTVEPLNGQIVLHMRTSRK